MEIRDPIHGTIELSSGEGAVVETPAFQRLRAIKQLGFSEFSFPGATHNRFIHSIGVSHIAGLAFDQIFKNFNFQRPETRTRLRQTTKLAALLHDIGHGPLSHTLEEVMPPLKELKVQAYQNRRQDLPQGFLRSLDRRANHEDYTIKFVTDSPIAETIRKSFSDISPLHIACLIDKTLACPDDFFVDGGLNFRTILSQLVSSEMDVDRMDYLERDAYFCGTNYGKVELEWLLGNLTFHRLDDNLHLALNRRALYTFDDFLLSRHHMHLMVYFHHKSIVYEEMIYRYLTSNDCTFYLPADIEKYIQYTDFTLYEHLARETNKWARRIAERQPYRMLFELHSTEATGRPQKMKEALEGSGVETILASSTTRLSKYHGETPEDKAFQIFVVDQYDRKSKPYPIEESTKVFAKYEEIRRIERLYVSPEQYDRAAVILENVNL